MVTTKIYDGKILASALTAALSNPYVILQRISSWRSHTPIPTLSDFVLQSDETCSHKLMAQQCMSYSWSIVSEPTSAAFWDIKWLLTNNDSEGQQRGCTEGQHLHHPSVKQCQTWFINLAQEVAAHGVSKAMKVTNQMACLAAKQALQPERIYITTIYLMLQGLSSSCSVTGEGHSSAWIPS